MWASRTSISVPLALFSEKAMAPHSSTLAWKIPWTEEPCRLQSMGSPRIGHDWATSLSLFTFLHWRRKWQPTPMFLPGESLGRGSLVGCRLWGPTESDTTEATQQQQQGSIIVFSSRCHQGSPRWILWVPQSMHFQFQIYARNVLKIHSDVFTLCKNRWQISLFYVHHSVWISTV